MSRLLLDANGMKRTLSRLAHEILDENGGTDDLVVVGVMRRGYPVAKRLAFLMTQVEGNTVPCGKLDTSRFRDDDQEPSEIDETEIPFAITGKRVVLVDEVVHTGRTIRAALDGLFRNGRPSRVQLAVLFDRGQRELPVQPDFVGRRVEIEPNEHILVRVHEIDGLDSVEIVHETEREVVH